MKHFRMFLIKFGALFFLLSAPLALAGSDGAYVTDILFLQEGKTEADAVEYFKRVEPILKKHGMKRKLPMFKVIRQMSGSLKPQLVNIWTVSDPENTFKNIFADPNYQKNIKFRNSTFEMPKSELFLMQKVNKKG